MMPCWIVSAISACNMFQNASIQTKWSLVQNHAMASFCPGRWAVAGPAAVRAHSRTIKNGLGTAEACSPDCAACCHHKAVEAGLTFHPRRCRKVSMRLASFLYSTNTSTRFLRLAWYFFSNVSSLSWRVIGSMTSTICRSSHGSVNSAACLPGELPASTCDAEGADKLGTGPGCNGTQCKRPCLCSKDMHQHAPEPDCRRPLGSGPRAMRGPSAIGW